MLCRFCIRCVVQESGMEIGSLVRVECNGQFRRGMIACINTPSGGSSSDDVTYDVIYKNNEEENNISITRIQPLLDLLPLPSPHSLSHDESNDIHHLEYLESLKSCGNNLFKSKDYEGAYEYYLQAHHYIQKLQLLTIGKRVLIAIKSYQKSGSIMNYEIGTITDITTTTTTGSSSSRGNENKNGNEDNNHILTVDVMYDTYLTPDDNNDEEINIQISRIIPLYELKNENQLLAIELQRSIWMNLSKCATKRNLKGWAVHWALLAVGLVKGELSLFQEEQKAKYLSDAVYILAKGFISSFKPNLAKKVALELKSIEEYYSLPSTSIRSSQLMKEIESLKNQKLKENKILAKNIAEWVDKAMKEGGNAVQFKNSNPDEDIDIMEDLQGDEIRLPNRAEGKEYKDEEDEMKSSKKYDSEEEKGDCIVM